MERNEIPAGRDGIDARGLLPESAGIHDVGGKRLVGLVFGGREIQWDVGLLEGADLVVAGIFGIGFVLGSVDQVEVEAVLPFADHDGFPRERDLGVGGVAEVGHEDALPYGGALGVLHVLNVEDFLGESFIKNAGLNLEGNLGAFEAVFEVSESGLSAGRDVEAIEERKDPCGHDEERKGAEESPDAHAAGTHGGDFAVGGETAETDKDSDQHAHGQRVGEGQGNGEKEDFGDAGQGSAGADDEFEDASEVAGEEDKGEDRRADQRVRRHFA